MFFNAAVTLFVAVTAARAIQITSPNNQTTWTTGVSQTIEWTYVDTDAANFTIQIQIPDPYSTQSVATDVITSDGSYSYTPDSSLTAGVDYRVNFISSSNGGILAQSGYFTVADGTDASSSASASSSTSASAQSSSSAGSSAVSSASTTSSSATGSASASASASSASAAASASASSSGASTLVPSFALMFGSLLALLI